MSAELTRHLLKAAGSIAIFLGVLTTAAFVVAHLSLLFLQSQGIRIRSRASWFEIVSRGFTALARRKSLSAVVVAFTCLTLRASLIPITKVTAPSAHDEFSYLLAADTFVHKRLTNPTPPLWFHFESIHINLKPTYMSMYPPGQGLMLAVGQILGHPWISIWLMAGLGCAATCWALQGWLPPKWALLGGVLAILQFGLLCYWSSTYYCTWLPAFGGALVLGALPRLQKRPQALLALLLATGVAVLALTRPYEGLVFCLPVAGALLAWMWRSKNGTFGPMFSRVLFPITSVLVLLALFLAYYNWRVSGNALLMPYKLNQQTYAVVPLFTWEHLRSDMPVYRNPEMRNYYVGWEVSEYRNTITCGFAKMTWIKFKRYWAFYFGPILSIPFIALPVVLTDRRIRFLLIVLAVTMVGLELEVWSHPHYAAALTCAFLGIELQCMRHLQFWRWRSWQIGRTLNWVVVLGCFAFDAAWLSAMAMQINYSRLYMAGNQQRESIEWRLEQTPGTHLIFVHYTPSHQVYREWVYNRADIEHAQVVWARDLGEECNEKLIDKLKDRQVWLVEPDANPTVLERYSTSPSSSTGSSPCIQDSKY